MEVSWYLRFGRKDTVEVILKEDRLQQAENVLYTETDWELETEPFSQGLVLARYRRKQ